MGFTQLKPKLARKASRGAAKKKHPVSPFSDLYEQAINRDIDSTAGRPPELRPSAFPLCPILVWMKLTQGAKRGYWGESGSFQSKYFSTVGTDFHSMIQYFIGMSGKIYGNWMCINNECKKGRAAVTLYNERGEVIRSGKITAYNTTDNECPCCGEAMQYEEIEVRYKGIKGHIDCIIDLGDGKYWVGDYKTSSNWGLDNKILPMNSHLKQIPAYVYILRKKYKLNVVGFSLLYVTRDNPWRFKETPFEWNHEWTEYASDMLRGEKRKYKAALHTFVDGDLDRIIEHKPCKSEAFYHKEISYYNECPLLGICFEKRKLRAALEKHKARHTYSKADMRKIILRVDPDGEIYENQDR